MATKEMDLSRSMSKSRASSSQFDQAFQKKKKREMAKVALQTQKDFQKNLIEEEKEEEEEDYYESDIFLKRTFKDVGAKLYKAYMHLLLADEKNLKLINPNKIMSSYLNNGQLYDQDYLDERDHHPGDLVIEFPNPDYTKNYKGEKDKEKDEKQKPKQNEKDQKNLQNKKPSMKGGKENPDENPIDVEYKETAVDQNKLDTETEDQQITSKNDKETTNKKRISLNQARDDFKKAFSNVFYCFHYLYKLKGQTI